MPADQKEPARSQPVNDADFVDQFEAALKSAILRADDAAASAVIERLRGAGVAVITAREAAARIIGVPASALPSKRRAIGALEATVRERIYLVRKGRSDGSVAPW